MNMGASYGFIISDTALTVLEITGAEIGPGIRSSHHQASSQRQIADPRCRDLERPLDDLKLVIRVPATGWGGGLTDDAARALESQVTTLRLLERETTIPVPRVLAFDTSCDNEIGAPYLCMSFIPGRRVIGTWFDSASGLEERRLETLASIARAVAQLSKFRFQKIGSPQLAEDGSLTVGPLPFLSE